MGKKEKVKGGRGDGARMAGGTKQGLASICSHLTYACTTLSRSSTSYTRPRTHRHTRTHTHVPYCAMQLEQSTIKRGNQQRKSNSNVRTEAREGLL